MIDYPAKSVPCGFILLIFCIYYLYKSNTSGSVEGKGRVITVTDDDYVLVEAHVLATPVIHDIDGDGIQYNTIQ